MNKKTCMNKTNFALSNVCDLSGTPTHNPGIRSAMLYAVEL